MAENACQQGNTQDTRMALGCATNPFNGILQATDTTPRATTRYDVVCIATNLFTIQAPLVLDPRTIPKKEAKSSKRPIPLEEKNGVYPQMLGVYPHMLKRRSEEG